MTETRDSAKDTETPGSPYPGPSRKDVRIVDWKDHGILRRIWFNTEEIAPGVFRSNQPSFDRLRHFKQLGVTHVLNFRGNGGAAAHRVVRDSCEALGLTLVPLGFSARKAPPKDTLLALVQTLRTIPRPFVMHCKSGADRTGLASAIYLIAVKGEHASKAMRMLSPRYVHLKFTKTGVMDYIIESFAAHVETNAKAGREISFEDWLASAYDHEALQDAFNNKVPVKA